MVDADTRLVIDGLLDDFDSHEELEIRAKDHDVTRVVCAWVTEVHQLARAGLLLLDSGLAQEAHIIARQAIEFTIAAHWLSQAGQAGLYAFAKEHGRNIRNVAREAEGGRLEFPEELLASLDNSNLPEVSETATARHLIKMCDEIGVRDSLYVMYRILSSLTHPSMFSASVMWSQRDDGQWDFRRSSAITGIGLDQMLGFCLVWAGRALDELVKGKPRKQVLQNAAKKLGARRTLPYRQERS